MENALGSRHAYSLAVVRDKFTLKPAWVLFFILATVVSAVWKPDVARALEIPGSEEIAIFQLDPEATGVAHVQGQLDGSSRFDGGGHLDLVTRTATARSTVLQRNAMHDADGLAEVVQGQARHASVMGHDRIDEGALRQGGVLIGISGELRSPDGDDEPEYRQNTQEDANQEIPVLKGKTGTRNIDTVAAQTDGGPLGAEIAVFAALGVGAMWIITLMGILGGIDNPVFRPFSLFAGLDIFIGGLFFSLTFTCLLWLIWP